MKRIVIIAGIGIAMIALTAFGIIKNNDEGDKKKTASEKTGNTVMAASLPGNSLNFSTIYATNTNLNFRVRGKNEHPVTQQKLLNASKLGDIIDYYPENWVDNYESVEISVENNGIIEKAVGSNQVLNRDQKRILQTAGLNGNIDILVNYKVKNDISGHFEDKQMNVAITVIPEKEAEYTNGYNELIRYLVENSKREISEVNPNSLEPAFVWFTVTENGKAVNINLKKSSGFPQIDKLMVELIRDMPAWKPAENAKGEKVTQNFELAFGGLDGC